MKGTRPLTASEVAIVADTFDGTYATRNRCLFMIGVSTGGRISELLNLTIGDVYQNGRLVTDLHYRKSIVKGKEHARSVPVNRDGTKAITEIIAWHTQQYGCLDDKRPLFPSRNRQKGILPITRQQAHKIFKRVCQQAALNGNLATHSLRINFESIAEDTEYIAKEFNNLKVSGDTQTLEVAANAMTFVFYVF